jgi:hypothetical protein
VGAEATLTVDPKWLRSGLDPADDDHEDTAVGRSMAVRAAPAGACAPMTVGDSTQPHINRIGWSASPFLGNRRRYMPILTAIDSL